MNDYKAIAEDLQFQRYELAEKILKDNTIDPYERFETVEEIYPIYEYIIYPFKKLVDETLKDKVPAENLQYVRPRYHGIVDYAERYQNITFASLVESFMDDVYATFDEQGDKSFEEFTEDELNAPVVELFSFDDTTYKFSFNKLVETLTDYAIETKTSGYRYN